MPVNRFLVPAALAALFAVSLPAAHATETAKNGAIRIVACDQPVQSRKRGICANHLETADFPVLAPGISWWYNWDHQTTDRPPKGTKMEFLPMAWGDRPTDLSGLESYLAAGHHPRQIMAINEPNLRGQAYLSPEQTAALYAKIKAIGDRYHIPVMGPQMALGSPTADSITALDPIEKKQTTYTFMVPFEKAFLHHADRTEVRATSLHSYGNVGELRWATDLMHKEFQRPVWVTEYAHWDAADPASQITYLMQATDFLERTPYVEGYAWFKERGGKDAARLSLLAPDPGKLTPLGAAYVAMPVHDTDLYYRVPGRLEAEKYVALNGLDIWPTTDTDGFAQMGTTEAGGWVDYNIQVDKVGAYTLSLRISGKPGQIDVLQGDHVLGSVNPTAGDTWQTVTTTVTLPKGPQTLRIRCAAKGQLLNWIAFQKR